MSRFLARRTMAFFIIRGSADAQTRWLRGCVLYAALITGFGFVILHWGALFVHVAVIHVDLHYGKNFFVFL
jgi:hypothetical protein